MRHNEQELPFFVYGTLRDGEANAHRLHKNVVRTRPGCLCGAQMFDLGPYPMILEINGCGIEVREGEMREGEEGSPNLACSRIIGELVEIEPDSYKATLRGLDQLEGVDSRNPESEQGLYRRVAREIRLDDGEVIMAWVYFGRKDLAERGRLVARGDWKMRFKNQVENQKGEALAHNE